VSDTRPRPALTARQEQVLRAFVGWLLREGHAPTVRELAELLGVRHHNALHSVLLRLEEKGWLHAPGPARKSARRARTVRVAGLRLRPECEGEPGVRLAALMGWPEGKVPA